MGKTYTPEYQKTRDELRFKWLMGNRDAIEFVQILTNAAELWDDIQDCDTASDMNLVDKAFLGMLFELPCNEFFLKHRASLFGIMMVSVNAWKDSEQLRQLSDEKLRRIAFHQRFMLLEVTKFCAFLVGGYSHMRAMSPEITKFYAYETFEEWDVENA